MASVTILSDNGATSGSAGLKTSGGNDGVLLLQTTTSGGTPTTAISISNTQVVTYTNQPTYTGGTANGVLYLNGSKAVTSGTALVFDGTNLGVGVTPSAWGSGWSAFQVGGNGSLFAEKTAGASKLVALTQNAYHNGTNNIYISSDLASRYRQGSGAHIWETAASGTAGNAISFTQAMTLDASGNLGIGTTSPGSRLHVTGSNGLFAQFLNSTNSTGEGIVLGSGSSLGRISTNGASTAMAFEINATEKARIDSSGNLLVGTTSFTSGGIVKTVVVDNSTSAGFQIARNGNVASYIYSYSTVGYRVETTVGYPTVQIVPGGTGGVQLTSGATSWASLSDETTKTDLAPITDAATKVATLRAVTGRFKTDEVGKSRAFLLAQDVLAVLPEAVTTYTEKDGTEYLGLSYTEVIPLLVEAIKELKAEIDALKGQA